MGVWGYGGVPHIERRVCGWCGGVCVWVECGVVGCVCVCVCVWCGVVWCGVGVGVGVGCNGGVGWRGAGRGYEKINKQVTSKGGMGVSPTDKEKYNKWVFSLQGGMGVSPTDKQKPPRGVWGCPPAR
jgi:hypothetical protein